mgnify:CR=1 FL=1
MDPFIAQIMLFGGNFAPQGYTTCEGQLLAISQWSAVFSLMGTTYGGDGRTTFGVPDLRGRSAIGQGNGPGLTPRPWGQRGGAETATLTVNNIPSHGHSINAAEEPTTDDPSGAFISATGSPAFAASSTVVMAPNAVANTGGGQSFNIMNPFLSMYYCIALVGVFPSRS